MEVFPIYSQTNLSLFRPHFFPNVSSLKPINPSLTLFSNPNKTLISLTNHLSISKSTPNSSDFDLVSIDEDEEENGLESVISVSENDSEIENGIDIEIVKLGKNARRISSRIAINANLETVWNLLTDYEKLADFIPALAVNQLLEKTENRARLFQIGQQNLAFGFKFNAKGIVDCYEKDLETVPFGQRRNIEFKMIEGDFQIFEGKWSIEETNNESQEDIEHSLKQEFRTTLSYVVDVKPKLWLPVRLIEGRLCREIKLNLLCIREQAQKAVHDTLHTC